MSLLSEARSDVLFSLILGRTNPKAIAEHIGDSPSSVVEQLNKLREEGYVKRGEKDGKYQPYLINWHRLIDEAIRLAPLLSDSWGVLYTANKDEESERGYKSIRRNVQLRKFIRAFIQGIARRESEVAVHMSYYYREMVEEPLRGWRTLDAVMRDFEYGLLFIFPKLDKSAMKGMSELYEGLKLWYDLCELALQSLVAKPFKEGIQRVLPPSRSPV